MLRSHTEQYSCGHSFLRELGDGVGNRYCSLLFAVVLSLFLGIAAGNAQTINFTGDAEADFAGAGVSLLDFSQSPDVGVPFQVGAVISGWDIKSVYFATDLNQLFIGIDYFGIAGDADGNGDPGSASPELAAIGGQDLPDFEESESFVIEIDLDQDGAFDIISGVPGGDPSGGTLGCENFSLNDCFGLYNHSNDGTFNSPAFKFESLIDGTNTLFASPSDTAPDIEYTIAWNNISGINSIEPDMCEIIAFDIRVYSGSFQDAGIGEDFIPPQLNASSVTLEVCTDCEGTPFGSKKVDLCGVCGGNNTTCGVKTIVFTGDPESDFTGEGIYVLEDGTFLDVGTPPGWPYPFSGWDIKTVYLFTNLNQLFIGIDYFGVAGDADGDGNPGATSASLESRGGQDLSEMAMTETIEIEIDIDRDGTFDIATGVPGGDPDGFPSLGCTMFDFNDCFGLYNHTGDSSSIESGRHFASFISPIETLFALPSSETPDIEYTIEGWDMISGWEIPEPDSCETFEFDLRIFTGSFEDDGIGEDTIPNDADRATIMFEVCTDCDGLPFGPNGPGECGCGVEEVDTDGNGIIDCKEVELTVNLEGDGGGVVTSDIAGIDCPGNCSEIYEEGTVVTLSAESDEVSQFAGWTGDPDCEDGVVTLNENKSCTATFDYLPLLLSSIYPAVSGNPNFMVADNATPNGPVAFIWGFILGVSNVTIGCGSVGLGIAPFQLLGIVNAGANQVVNFAFFINTGTFANPTFTQAVDLDTCRASDVGINIITSN